MTVEEINQQALEAGDVTSGTTINERLHISGLMDEFDKAMESNKIL